MTDVYYKILGVEKNADLADIKKAFRRRAKSLHPDINQKIDAHERFILLNEAYEYLINLKTGKVYNQNRHSYTRPKSRYKSHEDWQQEEREKARQRARKHASMHYDAFMESRYYKTASSLNTIVDFLNLLISITIFIIPVVGYFTKGIFGLIGGLVVMFVTAPLWANSLMHNRPKLNFKEIGLSFERVIKTKTFVLIIASALNLFLVFRIGLSTLINVWILLAVFITSIILGYLASIRLEDKFHKRLTFLVIAPGIVNLYLFLNFVISTNEITETYSFTHELENIEWGEQKTTQITLGGDKYAYYSGIRMFFDFDKMKDSKTIEYHFADGLLGLRVMKSYKFK